MRGAAAALVALALALAAAHGRHGGAPARRRVAAPGAAGSSWSDRQRESLGGLAARLPSLEVTMT